LLPAAVELFTGYYGPIFFPLNCVQIRKTATQQVRSHFISGVK